MSDQGMRIIHIARAGPEHVIEAGGASWRFEMHRYFGPVPLTPWGEVAPDVPGEDSPFWTAVEAWDRQGRRLEGDRCVWDPAGAPCVE